MVADSQFCYVGVNTNSSFLLTGDNAETSPRLFQDNLRSGFAAKAIKVSDMVALFLSRRLLRDDTY